MKKLAVRAVMFDLDGTLLDTAADLHEAANRMLRDAGLAPLSRESVTGFVGRGIPNLVKRCLTGARGQAPTEAEWEARVASFRAHYRVVNGAHTVAYPGVLETLQALRAAAVPIVCVTNKSAEFSEPLLAKTGLAPYFKCVVSGDTLPHKKPHPAPLLHVCEQLGTPPEHTLMIGDSGNDIAAARAAGCPVFCVPYGYNEGVAVRAEDCDALLAAMPDALALIELPPSANIARAA